MKMQQPPLTQITKMGCMQVRKREGTKRWKRPMIYFVVCQCCFSVVGQAFNMHFPIYYWIEDEKKTGLKYWIIYGYDGLKRVWNQHICIWCMLIAHRSFHYIYVMPILSIWLQQMFFIDWSMVSTINIHMCILYFVGMFLFEWLRANN